MKRLALFAATNIAVLLVISVVFQLLGLDRTLAEGGGLNLTALLIMSAVFGAGGSLISLAMSKTIALRSTRARVIAEPRQETERWLLATVRRQAEQAGIGIPDVAVYDSPTVNAFATGARRNDALVAVSTGLLRSMRREEVEAVLGHEVAHIANGDMVTMTLLQGVLNTFVIFLSRVVGHVVDRAVLRSQGTGPGYFLTSIIAQVVFGFLASFIVFWFSRQREFRADEGGAALAGRGNMIAALRRLEAQQQGAGPLPGEMAAMGIFGISARGWQRLRMTHPPLAERIAALENRAAQ